MFTVSCGGGRYCFSLSSKLHVHSISFVHRFILFSSLLEFQTRYTGPRRSSERSRRGPVMKCFNFPVPQGHTLKMPWASRMPPASQMSPPTSSLSSVRCLPLNCKSHVVHGTTRGIMSLNPDDAIMNCATLICNSVRDSCAQRSRLNDVYHTRGSCLDVGYQR